MSKKNVLERIDDVLELVCAQALDMWDSEVPVSCTYVAKQLGISLYAARTCMHKLAEDGYVVKDSYVYVPDDDFPSAPYNGWHMTPKAKETDAFQKASLREAQLCAKCFEGTVEEWMNIHRKYS